MKIELRRLNKAVHFECRNEDGLTVQTDGSPDVGGEGKGVRPMQMLLMSLAACSSIDVVHLLTKMRQAPDDIRVEVSGDRVAGEIPGVFRKIHLTYFITGALKTENVEKAIGMSVEKYCSVAAMLSSTADITWSLQLINPPSHEI